jgi:hypothetical protein
MQTFADRGGVVILYLAITSRMIPVVEDINDKAEHGIVFYSLALFPDFSFHQNGFGRRSRCHCSATV